MGKRKTKQDFIETARIVHGNKYDYSKVEYVNNRTKVCIICPEHGEFWQTPHDHLDKCGCPFCSSISRINKRKTPLNTFLERAKEVHGDKYDYSKTVYKNAHTKISIICPEHGEFNITPNHHLKGQGCPLCGNERKGSYQKSNTEQFINKATEIHKGKYDYSKTDYKNNRIKVRIICPEHGEFLQKPLDHLGGHGCPICGMKNNISEKLVFDAIKQYFPNTIYQYRPQWLHGKTSSQSLDIFIPDYNIGIEYQGIQHFSDISFFNRRTTYDVVKERDLRKYNKCKENNVTIFYISFEKQIPNDYFAPVYKTIDELIEVINKHIDNQDNIKLTENELKYVLQKTIRNIIK